jgi:hypothetical protein
MTFTPDQLRDHIDLMSSGEILADPLDAPEVLENFEEFLRVFHDTNGLNRLDQRPEAAEQHVRQDLRRCVQRVVAHRVAVSCCL